tara:strand:- start:2918 stop:3163 length:246 start_codon:yes stop_codon:yes gene_type:complete
MSTNNLNKDYTLMYISCKECDGTGFIELTEKEKEERIYCKYCKKSTDRCFRCENVKRLGKYDYCKKCSGQGYTEVKVKKSN